jgi:hypothetical protein
MSSGFSTINFRTFGVYEMNQVDTELRIPIYLRIWIRYAERVEA